MFRRPLILPAFALLIVTSALATSAGKPSDDGVAAVDLTARFVVAEGIRQDKLTLFPILDTEAKPRPQGDFDLLGAAMEAKTLTITEVSADGTVATLKVLNTGKKPVLLLAGDVITGGKQDRIITQDVILDSNSVPTTVAVNCVEAGRWNANSTHFSYGGRAENDLQQTVEMDKDQSKTWAKVAEVNASKAERFVDPQLAPSTGTYNASLSNPKVIEARDAIVRGLAPELDKQSNLVGLVVAIGDEVVAGELFGHPNLFERSEVDLLNAFALEAISSEGSGRAPSTAEASAFLQEALTARATRTQELPNATRVEFEEAELEGSMLRSKAAEVIHMNTYAK